MNVARSRRVPTRVNHAKESRSRSNSVDLPVNSMEYYICIRLERGGLTRSLLTPRRKPFRSRLSSAGLLSADRVQSLACGYRSRYRRAPSRDHPSATAVSLRARVIHSILVIATSFYATLTPARITRTRAIFDETNTSPWARWLRINSQSNSTFRRAWWVTSVGSVRGERALCCGNGSRLSAVLHDVKRLILLPGIYVYIYFDDCARRILKSSWEICLLESSIPQCKKTWFTLLINNMILQYTAGKTCLLRVDQRKYPINN